MGDLKLEEHLRTKNVTTKLDEELLRGWLGWLMSGSTTA
jgi:hypothetical protein